MKKLIKYVFIIAMASPIFAQDEGPRFWDHVQFGGGIGLSMGNGFFSGSLLPSAIYRFDPQLALGTSLNLTYNSLRNEYNSTIVGIGFLGLYNVIPQLQISAEFEQLYVSRKFESITGIPDESYWYPALFLGGGFRNGNVTVGVRYDVLYDSDRSIYANPWAPFVRVYF
jgi:hypothetical protein